MPKIALFFLSLLLLNSCGSFSSSDKDSALLQLQVGTSQLQNGAYPQALATLLKAESLDGDNPVIQNNLGLAYFVRDHFAEAEKHLRKAIQLKENYTDAHNNLGRTLIELGNYDQAISELEIAIKDLTYTTPEKPILNLGMVYFYKKNYTLSIKYLLKSLDIQRDNCLAHSYLGRSFFEIKDFSKSSAELDRAASFCLRTQYDEPQYYSALSYYQLGMKNLAVSRLEDLLKLYPNGKYFDRAKSMLEVMKR